MVVGGKIFGFFRNNLEEIEEFGGFSPKLEISSLFILVV